MYSLEQLKTDRALWQSAELIPVSCDWCKKNFEIKYGTLYNIIRREADGIYCNRECAGLYRTSLTQKKYQEAGGKICKRCGEFKILNEFSTLPNPPYYRAECKRCHNYKPARQYSLLKEKASRFKIIFNLDLNQYLEVFKFNCFYCGSSSNLRLELKEHMVGYCENNLITSCYQCQKFKNNLNHEDFINQCHKIIEHLKEANEKK